MLRRRWAIIAVRGTETIDMQISMLRPFSSTNGQVSQAQGFGRSTGLRQDLSRLSVRSIWPILGVCIVKDASERTRLATMTTESRCRVSNQAMSGNTSCNENMSGSVSLHKRYAGLSERSLYSRTIPSCTSRWQAALLLRHRMSRMDARRCHDTYEMRPTLFQAICFHPKRLSAIKAYSGTP